MPPRYSSGISKASPTFCQRRAREMPCSVLCETRAGVSRATGKIIQITTRQDFYYVNRSNTGQGRERRSQNYDYYYFYYRIYDNVLPPFPTIKHKSHVNVVYDDNFNSEIVARVWTRLNVNNNRFGRKIRVGTHVQ